MANLMRNTIIHLIGYPGVGKYTIGSGIAKKTGAILVDNQLTAMPLFTVMAHDTADGNFQHIDILYKKYHEIAAKVLEMAVYARAGLSYVFTDVLFNTEDGSNHFEKVQEMAEKRGSIFLPIVLTCDNDVLMERVTANNRAQRFKLADARAAAALVERNAILIPNHPNLKVFDITNCSAEESIQVIIEYAQVIAVSVGRIRNNRSIRCTSRLFIASTNNLQRFSVE